MTAPSTVETRLECAVCGNPDTVAVADSVGRQTGATFHLRRCVDCGFVFVSNPWLDFDRAYGEDYYNGRGADPKLNYLDEALHPERAVRRHELTGVVARVVDLTKVSAETRWLDYGCGMGGLVEHLRKQGVPAVGFEQGWAVTNMRDRKVPMVTADDLANSAGAYDVVTAIEVVEHVTDPVALLTEIRALLKPGGLLFMTTGNVAPFREKLARWPYVTPEVHLSFFDPSTLSACLRKAGFEPAFPGFGPGWPDIYRYKLLMTLRRKHISRVEGVVPWSLLARTLDAKLQLSAQPVGWAR